jgi:hypothetical protein
MSEPSKPDYENMKDKELNLRADNAAQGLGAIGERLRRLTKSTEYYSEWLMWLTIVIAVLTFVLVVLTGALVVLALKH